MRRFLVELQYYGKRYGGFQRQKNAPTVQGEVERALFRLFGRTTEIVGCSRTDAGVSAQSYFFHFDAETALPEERVCFKLNRFLPKDIQAVSSKEVAPSFDARKNVKRKTYVYTLYRSAHLLPLYAREGVQMSENANLDEMRRAAGYLVGQHDFAAFRTVGYEEGAKKKSTVRTVEKIEIVQEGRWVRIFITADGFLYNMVRIVVGTLVEVGEGKRTSESVLSALESRDRAQSGKTMPPKALRLYSVEY